MDNIYFAEIKELGNQHILTPSIQGTELTKEELIRFFGLNEPDVEWYRLYHIVDGEKVEM